MFNYHPIYYDKDEEERRQKFGKVDGSLEKAKEEGNYVPGSYLSGSFRDGNYSRRKGSTKAQTIIGWVGLILLVGVMIYMIKFYSLL